MAKRIWATLGVLFVACGGNTAGETVRPTDPTVAHARGDDTGPPAVCHEPTAEGTPLIVDWKPEERNDLEAAMKEGVAVVHYDCKTLKVLPDCHPPGKYAFLGTTKREQLISLENADAAQANLPLHGASIGASLSRGSAIDVGLIMIGKTTTPLDGVTKTTIGAHCDGATHFVQSTTVGAFAMKSATVGDVHVKAAIDVFGASASSSSNKTNENKDGEPSACNSADVDAPKPPNGCGAPLRVRLLAIADGDAPPPAAPSKDAPKEVTCPQGLVASNGACAPPDPAKQHDCGIEDTAEFCGKQCDAGNGSSCGIAAMFYMIGMNVPAVDDAKADGYLKKGCDLGDMQSCGSYASSLKNTDKAQAIVYATKSCDGGYGPACVDLGTLYQATDLKKSARNFNRACDVGYTYACIQLGYIYQKGGPGVTADPIRSSELFVDACNQRLHDPEACYNAGLSVKAKDRAQAKKYFKMACDKTYPIACTALKKMK